MKVTDAKISHLSLIENGGRLIIGTAYKVQDLRNQRSIWRFDDFQLDVQTINQPIDSGESRRRF